MFIHCMALHHIEGNTVEVKAAIKVGQITISNTTAATATFNKTEQLGKIGHTGRNGVAVGFATAPEYVSCELARV